MSGRKMKLDFTGVESFERAPEGRHVCKIVSADLKQSQGGNDMIVVAFEVTKGEGKGSRVYENYPLMESALWKLKGLLQAIGMKADGKVQLDLDKLIGKVCEVEVKYEDYEGKTRARVDSVYKLNVASDDDDDEDIEEDDDDEVEDDEDDDEEEEEEEKPAKKPAKKSSEKKPAKKPVKKEEEEEDDDDDWDDEDEDDEDEDEEPASKKKVAKKPAKSAPKKSAKKAEPEDDDEDDDDDDDWDEE